MLKVEYVVSNINQAVGAFYLKGKDGCYYYFNVTPLSWLNSGYGTDVTISGRIKEKSVTFNVENGIANIEHVMFPNIQQIQARWDMNAKEYGENVLEITVFFD